MSAKDPFQILADELTLLRHDMDKLQRTSLSRDEAEALNQIVAKAVADMRQATKEAPQAIRSALKVDRDELASVTTDAAVEAITDVLKDVRDQLAQERTRFAQAAGEARREAWRWFGGFWVWLAAMLATGAFLGLLAAYITEARTMPASSGASRGSTDDGCRRHDLRRYRRAALLRASGSIRRSRRSQLRA